MGAERARSTRLGLLRTVTTSRRYRHRQAHQQDTRPGGLQPLKGHNVKATLEEENNKRAGTNPPDRNVNFLGLVAAAAAASPLPPI